MHSTWALLRCSLAAGALWGAVGWLLCAKGLGTPIWAGVFASPAIGWLVTRLTHERFCGTGGVGRALWSVASLYLGAAAFGVACGVAKWLSRPTGVSSEVLLEPVLMILWGLTVGGFFLFLMPLAYFTHWCLERELSA
jgi:hypothetical protein